MRHNEHLVHLCVIEIELWLRKRQACSWSLKSQSCSFPLLFIFLLLFKYSCVHFPATTFLHPMHPHLTPSLLSPLWLCSWVLYPCYVSTSPSVLFLLMRHLFLSGNDVVIELFKMVHASGYVLVLNKSKYNNWQ